MRTSIRCNNNTNNNDSNNNGSNNNAYIYIYIYIYRGLLEATENVPQTSRPPRRRARE